MKQEEIVKVARDIKIIIEWFSEMTGGEYSVNVEQALELIIKLEEVK